MHFAVTANKLDSFLNGSVSFYSAVVNREGQIRICACEYLHWICTAQKKAMPPDNRS